MGAKCHGQYSNVSSPQHYLLKYLDPSNDPKNQNTNNGSTSSTNGEQQSYKKKQLYLIQIEGFQKMVVHKDYFSQKKKKDRKKYQTYIIPQKQDNLIQQIIKVLPQKTDNLSIDHILITTQSTKIKVFEYRFRHQIHINNLLQQIVNRFKNLKTINLSELFVGHNISDDLIKKLQCFKLLQNLEEVQIGGQIQERCLQMIANKFRIIGVPVLSFNMHTTGHLLLTLSDADIPKNQQRETGAEYKSQQGSCQSDSKAGYQNLKHINISIEVVIQHLFQLKMIWSLMSTKSTRDQKKFMYFICIYHKTKQLI